MEIKGQIIGGSTKEIVIREKNESKLELGELLIVENSSLEEDYTILQVKDSEYKSQAPQSTHELLSGMKLEGYNPNLGFTIPELANYQVGHAKALLHVQKKDGTFITKSPKSLPRFSNQVRSIKKEDLKFLEPENIKDSLFLGKIRSGSEVTDVDVYIDAEAALSHHILIPATTGRGKSNLVKVMLWGLLDTKKAGILVLDPHDEYFGRNGKLGLKDHPNSKEKLDYYSTEVIPGEGTLIINVDSVRPSHLNGIVSFTSAQKDAIRRSYNDYGKEWIKKIMLTPKIEGTHPDTLAVVKRKLRNVFGIKDENNSLEFKSQVFKGDTVGKDTVNDIVTSLKDGKIVIIDTSKLNDYEELLIGSIITERLFYTYKNYKSNELKTKPVISVVIEEAPRVLGNEALEQNSNNIYSTIAKEGRKFKMGLIAITQLASLIPRTILANMNTKIILGNEMALERSAIIESASQDLSDDNRIIASLDKGEAIVSSVFTRFAIPIYTPEFNKKFIEEYKKKFPEKRSITGKTSVEGL